MSTSISLHNWASCIGLPGRRMSSTFSCASFMLSWYGSCTSGFFGGLEEDDGEEGSSGKIRAAIFSALVKLVGIKAGFLSLLNLVFLLVPVSTCTSCCETDTLSVFSWGGSMGDTEGGGEIRAFFEAKLGVVFTLVVGKMGAPPGFLPGRPRRSILATSTSSAPSWRVNNLFSQRLIRRFSEDLSFLAV